MTISRVIFMAAGLGMATLPAMAADMPQERDPLYTEAPSQAAYLWAGPYVGLSAGYSWNKVDALGAAASSFDADGFLGGIQAGYNFQAGSFVYGVEGDFNFTGGSGATFAAPGVGIDQNWLGTIRARAGIAFDRSLIYATGGAAFSDVDVTIAGVAGQSETLTGWTVGAGWEHALTETVSMRAEYLYVDYGDKNLFNGVAPANIDMDQSIARLGVNWKLNFGN